MAEHYLDPYAIRGVFAFWDTANKAKMDSDFWVGEDWAWATDGYYMLRVWRGRYGFHQGIEALKAAFERPITLKDAQGKEISFSLRALYVEAAGGNTGAAIVETLVLSRFPALEINPNTSKEDRAGAALNVMANKPVYFTQDPAAYIGITQDEFIQQHLQFPRGRHDDAVDATSMALNHLNQYPIRAQENWREEGVLANQRLAKSASRRGPTMITRSGGSAARIQRGMFGGTSWRSRHNPR